MASARVGIWAIGCRKTEVKGMQNKNKVFKIHISTAFEYNKCMSVQPKQTEERWRPQNTDGQNTAKVIIGGKIITLEASESKNIFRK